MMQNYPQYPFYPQPYQTPYYNYTFYQDGDRHLYGGGSSGADGNCTEAVIHATANTRPLYPPVTNNITSPSQGFYPQAQGAVGATLVPGYYPQASTGSAGFYAPSSSSSYYQGQQGITPAVIHSTSDTSGAYPAVGASCCAPNYQPITWEPYPKGHKIPFPIPGAMPYGVQIPGLPYGGGYETEIVGRAVYAQQGAAVPSQSDVLSGSANILPSTTFKDQKVTRSYSEIKEDCLRSKRLWEDPEFPASNYSISIVRQPNRPIEWKRPNELVKNPQFIDVDGMSRFDVVQGELGDCWVLAAVANLTLNPDLIKRVVPEGQTFERPNYCGVFRFQFWYYGEWQEVVIDDRLPTYNGRLVYMHSPNKTEFWSALLEKAYAKLAGCYDNLRGGSTSESMTDFTGGFCEAFELKEKTPKIMLQVLQKAVERGSLMCCSINQRENMPTMSQLPNGLIMGHAYSLTDIKTVKVRSENVSLVRIRNPWGQAEWNGSFSDNSPEWQRIPEEERKKIGLIFQSDGEFWMTFQDFISNYELLEMCNLSFDLIGTRREMEALSLNPTQSIPPTMATNKKLRKWETTIIHGEWRRYFNAGGCRNNLQTFATNPQYRIKLTEVDEQDPERMCTVLIGLMQKDRRRVKNQAPSFLTIGFSVYKLNEADCLRPLDQTFFARNISKARSTFINLREVSGRFRLPPGTYAIIPSTFEPNIDGEFVLRIYSEKKCTADEIDEMTKLELPKTLPVSSTEKKEGVISAVEEVDLVKKAMDAFKAVASSDGTVHAYDLQKSLSKKFADMFHCEGFNLETVRSMISLKDRNYIGTLTLYEFIDLYRDLLRWGKVFLEYNPKKTGRMESVKMRDALKSLGFGLSNKVLKALIVRYSDKDGMITFDDFVNCALRLSSMLDKFKLSTPKDSQRASFSLDEFIMTTMYC